MILSTNHERIGNKKIKGNKFSESIVSKISKTASYSVITFINSFMIHKNKLNGYSVSCIA